LSQRSRRSISSIGFGSAKIGARILAKLQERNPMVEFDEILARKWQELDKTT
jgi:hypothetical protein